MTLPPKTSGEFLTLLILFFLISWVWIYVSARLAGSGWARSWFDFLMRNKSTKTTRKGSTKHEGE